VSPALDACPGVLTLHPARDGLVARIRLPGGYASAARWRALAGLSRDFGDGCVDVTARGNVQLRGLRAPDAEALAARAAAAGLMPSAQHDRARNITASPLAGLGGRPPLRALVDALDAALLAGPEFAALPGRFLFALDDGTGGASLASCDIGLCYAAGSPASGGPASGGPASGGPASGGPASGGPASGGPASGGPASGGPAQIGFDLIVAGRRAGVRLPAADAVRGVLVAARAALAAGVGASVTRIAALPDGGQSVAAAAGGILGAQASPDTRLPLGPASPAPAVKDAARAAPAMTDAARAAPAMSADPFAGAQVSHASHTGPARIPRPAPTVPLASGGVGLHDRDRFTGRFPGQSVTIMEEAHGGRTGGVGGVVVVAARLGRLSGEQIRLMTSLVADGEVVRVGVAGRLVIPLGDGAGGSGPAGTGLAATGPAGALARLAACGLIVGADDPMGDVTACSGAACHRSLGDVRGAAGPVSNYRKTHWAGCSRLCGCPPDAEPVVALDAARYRMPGEGGA